MTTDYVAIVGNGLQIADKCQEIEQAQAVIRFNSPPYTPEQGGARTDLLFMVNSSHHMEKWLSDDGFLKSPYFSSVSRIILPWHPDAVADFLPPVKLKHKLKGRKSHYTQQAFKILGAYGKEVSLLPKQFNSQCYKALGLRPEDKAELMPSTGFMGITYVLETFSQYHIKLYGFTWEGWSGHPWDREHQWLSACERISLPEG